MTEKNLDEILGRGAADTDSSSMIDGQMISDEDTENTSYRYEDDSNMKGDTYREYTNYTPVSGIRDTFSGRSKWKNILSYVLAAVLCMSFGAAGGIIGTKLLSPGGAGGSVVLYQSVVRPAEEGEDAPEALNAKQVAEMTSDSVVQITTETIQTSIYMQQYITSGAGSGVILSEDGYIVTNNHVISSSTKITVTLRDGTVYDASLVAADELSDLAVLKIDAEGLTPAVIGDSSLLSAGDSVLVVGNPLGELGGSISHGIISATDRKISVEGIRMTLIQTDAAINPGNSGGAMFNMYGELIGIVNCKSTGSSIDNLGFAIPVNIASPVIRDLIENGYVTGRAYMGVSMISVSDVFTAMQMRVNEYGVYITGVEKGSAAEKAGLKIGDRIISIADQQVSSDYDVQNVLLEYSAGDTVIVRISRGGQEQNIELTLSEYIPSNN